MVQFREQTVFKLEVFLILLWNALAYFEKQNVKSKQFSTETTDRITAIRKLLGKINISLKIDISKLLVSLFNCFIHF